MSMLFQRGQARIEANMTPMIDMTFLLIVFFVLVSEIVDLESVEMSLPRPREPASELASDESRAVINVVPAPAGRAAGYKLGSRLFAADAEGVEALTRALAAVFQESPALRVNVRADRATHYRWVQPALRSVAEAARHSDRPTPAGVNLVVVREDGR